MDLIDFEINLQACRENYQVREEQRFIEREQRRLAARTAVIAGIQHILPDHPEIHQVYLFGSVIRQGDFMPDSDVDVAVEGTNAEQYFSLWRDLENAAPGWLIDLREINDPSYFAETVRQRGELIYEREIGPAHI